MVLYYATSSLSSRTAARVPKEHGFTLCNRTSHSSTGQRPPTQQSEQRSAITIISFNLISSHLMHLFPNVATEEYNAKRVL